MQDFIKQTLLKILISIGSKHNIQNLPVVQISVHQYAVTMTFDLMSPNSTNKNSSFFGALLKPSWVKILFMTLNILFSNKYIDLRTAGRTDIRTEFLL